MIKPSKKIFGAGLWRNGLRNYFYQEMFVWDNVHVCSNEFHLVAEGLEKELSLRFPVRIVGIVNARQYNRNNRFDCIFLVHKFDMYGLMKNHRRFEINVKTWKNVLQEKRVSYPNRFIKEYPFTM